MGKSFSATNERFKKEKLKKVCKKFHKRVINHIFLFLLLFSSSFFYVVLLLLLFLFTSFSHFFCIWAYLVIFFVWYLENVCNKAPTHIKRWNRSFSDIHIHYFEYTFIFIKGGRESKKKLRQNFFINLVMIDTFYKNYTNWIQKNRKDLSSTLYDFFS